MEAASRAVVGLVPAAGRSRRMGRDKLFLPWGGTTVLGALVDALIEGGVERLAVVRRPDDARLEEWAAGRDRVLAAVNPRPEEGMLSTILAGLEALGGAERLAREAVLLICPGDHPAIRPETVRSLIAAARRPGSRLAVPVHDGRRGHPLALAGPPIAEIPRLDREVGLRQLLERHGEQVEELAVGDPGALADLDTPEQYRTLRP